MDRSIYRQLLDWKNGSRRKPLILKGARQVGKTWIIKQFGLREYRNMIYLNCHKNDRIKIIFERGYDIKRILRDLSALSEEKIYPQKSLIVFDEVQEVPEALASLKYFCEDAPEYHVIVAGSLLGLSIHQGISFPVGKVQQLEMYPMTFMEFLLAKHGEQRIEFLENAPLDELASLHSELIDDLREYYFAGGMPEAVEAYITHGDLQEVRDIQLQILSDYHDDISKHADRSILQRIYQVWNSIPQQLAKDNGKFVYGEIKKGARAVNFELAIEWLIDAGIVYRIPRLKKAGIPLKFYEDFSSFKLYPLDCGLMGAMVNAPASQILVENKVFTEYKGAFTEQYVLEQLLPMIGNNVFYLKGDNSEMEIDFLFQHQEKMIPVEVKAEENLRAKSLRLFVKEHQDASGVRISMSPYRKQDWMSNLPLYAVNRILEF